MKCYVVSSTNDFDNEFQHIVYADNVTDAKSKSQYWFEESEWIELRARRMKELDDTEDWSEFKRMLYLIENEGWSYRYESYEDGADLYYDENNVEDFIRDSANGRLTNEYTEDAKVELKNRRIKRYIAIDEFSDLVKQHENETP